MPPARGPKGRPEVGSFLVPAGSPGVRIVETWDHLGLRASGSHDAIFEDVLIPLDQAVELRAPKDWLAPDPALIAWTALTVAALYDGIAGAARNWLVGFLKSRIPSNLGAPLASLPRFQEALGEIEALLTVNRRLLATAAADTDRGEPPGTVESGLLKSTVTGNAIAAVEIALKLTGNPGLSRANPLERHIAMSLRPRPYPQDDSARIAGRAALGFRGEAPDAAMAVLGDRRLPFLLRGRSEVIPDQVRGGTQGPWARRLPHHSRRPLQPRRPSVQRLHGFGDHAAEMQEAVQDTLIDDQLMGDADLREEMCQRPAVVQKRI